MQSPISPVPVLPVMFCRGIANVRYIERCLAAWLLDRLAGQCSPIDYSIQCGGCRNPPAAVPPVFFPQYWIVFFRAFTDLIHPPPPRRRRRRQPWAGRVRQNSHTFLSVDVSRLAPLTQPGRADLTRTRRGSEVN